MTNSIYTECLLDNTSGYCKVVEFIGPIPEQNNFIYDISYYMYFIALILVILSPFYLLFKLINGTRRS